MSNIGLFARLAGRTALIAGLAFGGVSAQAGEFRAETAGVGAGAYLSLVAFSTIISKHTDHTIEVSSGINGVKAMIGMAQGKSDFAAVILSHYEQMKTREGNYEKLANAPELAGQIRSIISYPAGTYHGVVWEGSGIKTLADLKGKKVFLGPKNSAAHYYGQKIIDGDTGYAAGKDYELLELDFAGGEQAFTDGHVDFYLRTAPIGSAIIEQVGVSRPMRLLGFSEKGRTNAEVLAVTNEPGRSFDVIDPKTYSGQMNEEPVVTMGFWLGFGVGKHVDEQAVYEMTKALWEHIDEFKGTSKALFKPLSLETVFDQLDVPLHPGAYRYYKEIGQNVPDRLVPPEAES